MRLSIGIDIIEPGRFEPLLQLSDIRLQRIWSSEELRYCRTKNTLRAAAESLAVRFAAREATLKACAPYQRVAISFFAFSRLISITMQQGGPVLELDYQGLQRYYTFPEGITFVLSVSHNTIAAVAVVIASVG